MSYDDRVKITPIYYDRGVFYDQSEAHPSKIKKFSRAPFDVVQLEIAEGGPVGQFIRPRPTIFGSPDTLTTANTGHVVEGIGFLTNEHIVIGEHEVGAHHTEAGKLWTMFEMHDLTS